MAEDEVVVKRGPDGKVTVCVGEVCVEVPCEAKAEPEPEEGRVGGSLIDIQMVRRDDVVDFAKVDWTSLTADLKAGRADDGSPVVRRKIQ